MQSLTLLLPRRVFVLQKKIVVTSFPFGFYDLSFREGKIEDKLKVKERKKRKGQKGREWKTGKRRER